MDRIYLMLVFLILNYVLLGISFWIINRKDLDLTKETYAKKFWKDKFNNLQKEFETRDAESKEVIKNLQKENRRLREKLYKEKHSKHSQHSHRVIFTKGIEDEYIDEKAYGFVSDIIARNEDRKGYIEINNNLFKIKDIDCVLKLNKE